MKNFQLPVNGKFQTVEIPSSLEEFSKMSLEEKATLNTKLKSLRNALKSNKVEVELPVKKIRSNSSKGGYLLLVPAAYSPSETLKVSEKQLASWADDFNMSSQELKLSCNTVGGAKAVVEFEIRLKDEQWKNTDKFGNEVTGTYDMSTISNRIQGIVPSPQQITVLIEDAREIKIAVAVEQQRHQLQGKPAIAVAPTLSVPAFDEEEEEEEETSSVIEETTDVVDATTLATELQ